MRIAPKLMNFRVNMTYFVLNHDILFDYFNEAFLEIAKVVTHTLQNRLLHNEA